jgi:ribosome-binding protein aMBF1 (putative translation factor)
LPKSIHTNAYRVLIKKLVNSRKAAGLTQMELALELDRPQSFVAKYELQERRLDFVEVVRLARILQIDAVELMQSVELAIDE